MSDKPLSKQNRDELVATAEGLGLEVADDATKAQIVEQIEAAPQPPADDAQAGPDPDGDPDDDGTLAADEASADAPADQEVGDVDPDSGLVEVRRPITTFAANGDWTDPFSDLRVHQDSRVCAQSGSERDGDEAVVRVTPEHAEALGA